MKKLQLTQKEIKLLGLKVYDKTQKVLEESREDMLEYPRPNNVKGLGRFLGEMNFYAPFINDMTKIALTLKQ